MKNLFIILASAALLFACSDDDQQTDVQPTAEISVGTQAMTFLASGMIVEGENMVTVKSSADWRLSGKKTWCRPSAVQGKNGEQVEFVVDPNPDGESRSITYAFICGDKTTKLVVTQEGTDLIVPQDKYELGSADGQIKVKLFSGDIQLTPTVDDNGKSWITPFTTRSLATTYLYYNVTANDTYNPRTGKITLSADGVEPKVVTVNQAQNDEVKLEQDAYKVELEKSTVRVTVWSNVPYTVEIPEDAKSWLTLESQPVTPTQWSSQVLVFQIPAAEKYRLASITLNAGVRALERKFSIQQGDMPTFSVPDAIFSKYLLEQGYIISAGTGKYIMSAAGIDAFDIDVSDLYAGGGCKSLEGIENFTNLMGLNCRYNSIKSLDLSKNLMIEDVTTCVPNALEYLSVGANVTMVNFGGKNSWNDGKLKDFTTKAWSKKFTVVGENIQVVNLTNNQLETIDVSGCPNLGMLKCQQVGYNGVTVKTIYMSRAQEVNVQIISDPGTTIVYK